MKYKTLLFPSILLLAFIFIFIPYAGFFLVVNEMPVKSDVIILLTGGNVERHQKAIELYRQGYAQKIIITNALEDGIYEAILKAGIPHPNVLEETNADSTYTNAKYTLEIMKKNGYKSAIVVSSDYHMRRVKINFDRVYYHSGIKLTYCAAKTQYLPNSWLTDPSSFQTTWIEYLKIFGNALGFNGKGDKQNFKKIEEIMVEH